VLATKIKIMDRIYL